MKMKFFQCFSIVYIAVALFCFPTPGHAEVLQEGFTVDMVSETESTCMYTSGKVVCTFNYLKNRYILTSRIERSWDKEEVLMSYALNGFFSLGLAIPIMLAVPQTHEIYYLEDNPLQLTSKVLIEKLPVSNERVEIYYNSMPLAEQNTDSQGKMVINDVGPGVYEFSLISEQYGLVIVKEMLVE